MFILYVISSSVTGRTQLYYLCEVSLEKKKKKNFDSQGGGGGGGTFPKFGCQKEYQKRGDSPYTYIVRGYALPLWPLTHYDPGPLRCMTN